VLSYCNASLGISKSSGRTPSRAANVVYMIGLEDFKEITDAVMPLYFDEDYLKARRDKTQSKVLDMIRNSAQKQHPKDHNI
jgi:hypothetical protein